MTHFASRIAGVATLALAVLPLAAIATAASAAPVTVKVGDLDLNSRHGQQAFAQRAEAAAKAFCRPERNPVVPLARSIDCRHAVRAELQDKMQVVRQAQLARTTYAAR